MNIRSYFRASLGPGLAVVTFVLSNHSVIAQNAPTQPPPVEEVTGLKLPANLAAVIARQKMFSLSVGARIAPGSPTDQLLAATRTRAEEMGCDPNARSWQWENHGVFGNARDQRLCKACYVFASVGIVEGSYAISRHDANLHIPPTDVVEISEEQLFTCTPGDCANGGDPKNVLDFLKFTGGSPNSTQPAYNAVKLAQCPFPKPPPPFQVLDWGYTADMLDPPEAAIKSDVCAHGPVLAALAATQELANFRGSGVFIQPPNTLVENATGVGILNHAVIITGWDEDKKAWRIRNSWGNGFGDNGYAWIGYHSNYIGRVVNWADVVPPSATVIDQKAALSNLVAIRAAVSPSH
jgi:Papain family cysteine protease